MKRVSENFTGKFLATLTKTLALHIFKKNLVTLMCFSYRTYYTDLILQLIRIYYLQKSIREARKQLINFF